MDNNFKNNLAASFQKTIIKILKRKQKLQLTNLRKFQIINLIILLLQACRE